MPPSLLPNLGPAHTQVIRETTQLDPQTYVAAQASVVRRRTVPRPARWRSVGPRRSSAHVTEEAVVTVDARTSLHARRNLRVSDVMHRGAITCGSDVSGTAVARIMAAHRIHAVVVTGFDLCPALVTDGEIAEALYAGNLEGSSASELARPSPLVRPSDTLEYVLERLHERRTTHAVVADRLLRPLGVVSILDLIEATEGGDVQ